MTSPTIRRASATLAAISALTALSGCASEETAQAPGTKAAQQPLASARIAQLGFGPAAHYAVCQPPACPTVTRKTIAAEAGVSSVTVTPAARKEPLASPSGPAVPCPPPRAAESYPHQSKVRIAPRVKNRLEDPCGADAAASVTHIYFAHNDAKLDEQAKSAIGTLMPFAVAARSIHVTGYTDSVGNPAENRRLASRRAAAVRDYFDFITPGLADKTVVLAKGDCCFIATNAGHEGRRKNRRVEIVFQSKEGNAADNPATRRRPGAGSAEVGRESANAPKTMPGMSSSSSDTSVFPR